MGLWRAITPTGPPGGHRRAAVVADGMLVRGNQRNTGNLPRWRRVTVNGTPVRRHDLTVTTRYFILGTVTDTSLRIGEARYSPSFPGVHRFRVDASWARLPASRGIGPMMSLYARHEFCIPARYRIGQQYLLHVGIAGDTLVNLIGCGGVFPSDSGRTRAAIALLDSALQRR